MHSRWIHLCNHGFVCRQTQRRAQSLQQLHKHSAPSFIKRTHVTSITQRKWCSHLKPADSCHYRRMSNMWLPSERVLIKYLLQLTWDKPFGRTGERCQRTELPFIQTVVLEFSSFRLSEGFVFQFYRDAADFWEKKNTVSEEGNQSQRRDGIVGRCFPFSAHCIYTCVSAVKY